MQSVVLHRCGSPDLLAVQARLGRVTGLLFLVLAIFGMFAVLTLESLMVAGYILDSLATFFVPGHGGLTSAVLVASAIVGELGVTAWLLVKGVSVRRDGVTRSSVSAPPTLVDAPTPIATGGAR